MKLPENQALLKINSFHKACKTPPMEDRPRPSLCVLNWPDKGPYPQSWLQDGAQFKNGSKGEIIVHKQGLSINTALLSANT